MKVKVTPGKYIIAVSGGVDSVVLLHVLHKQKDVELVVAHFNHGIRDNAKADEEFIKILSANLNLPVEVGYGDLGAEASEEAARKARYQFLAEARQKHEASGIITAHHQDDLIETAMINILRGTGSRGLVAILNNKDITRPLLQTPKIKIVEYAKKNNLQWVEDESNKNPRYLRNSLRQVLAERLKAGDRQNVLAYINSLQSAQYEKDELMTSLSAHVFEDKQTIKRGSFIFLPNDVASEMMLYWLRQNHINADRRLINRLIVVVKTGRVNSLHSIDKTHMLKLGSQKAQLMSVQ